jgi:hypothetical protein
MVKIKELRNGVTPEFRMHCVSLKVIDEVTAISHFFEIISFQSSYFGSGFIQGALGGWGANCLKQEQKTQTTFFYHLFFIL